MDQNEKILQAMLLLAETLNYAETHKANLIQEIQHMLFVEGIVKY